MACRTGENLQPENNRPFCWLAEGLRRQDWLPKTGNCKDFFLWFTLVQRSARDGAVSGIPETKTHQRVAALLLANEFEELLDGGVVNNRAEIARRYKVTRARVTQVINLLTLPDEVQTYLMSLPPEDQSLYSERRLREVVSLRTEQAQLHVFQQIRELVHGTDAEV